MASDDFQKVANHLISDNDHYIASTNIGAATVIS
jgi:hypothetical protein